MGLGSIRRFPYLAAKYGGGIFLVIYIILALTFGYAMIVAETSIGRMTQKKPGWSLPVPLARSEMAVLWRLDQRDHSNPDRTVLFGHRRLGNQISWQSISVEMGQSLQRMDIFGSFISNGVSTELCFVIFCHCDSCNHLCRCTKRNRTCIQD